MVLQTTSRVQEFINTASVITKYKRLLTKFKCIKVKRVLTRVCSCSTCHESRVMWCRRQDIFVVQDAQSGDGGSSHSIGTQKCNFSISRSSLERGHTLAGLRCYNSRVGCSCLRICIRIGSVCNVQ